MAHKKEKPGVMLYYELRPVLRRLSTEQCGKLLRAIMDYAQDGIAPDFGEDAALEVAWDFMAARIDADTERYYMMSQARQEAAKKRWGNTLDANTSN